MFYSAQQRQAMVKSTWQQVFRCFSVCMGKLRFLIDTTLTSHDQSFREIIDTPDLDFLALRLNVIRDIVSQCVTEACANTQLLKNANLKQHDFQSGDRVFVSLISRWNRPEFTATNTLQTLSDLASYSVHNNLVKHAHFCTGEVLRNFFDVDKVKRLYETHRVTYAVQNISDHGLSKDIS
jgi:hypothetical protein